MRVELCVHLSCIHNGVAPHLQLAQGHHSHGDTNILCFGFPLIFVASKLTVAHDTQTSNESEKSSESSHQSVSPSLTFCHESTIHQSKHSIPTTHHFPHQLTCRKNKMQKTDDDDDDDRSICSPLAHFNNIKLLL